jgi:hypothetical protein
MNLPIPVVSIAERNVNTNINGREATPMGQPNNSSAVKYPICNIFERFNGYILSE